MLDPSIGSQPLFPRRPVAVPSGAPEARPRQPGAAAPPRDRISLSQPSLADPTWASLLAPLRQGPVTGAALDHLVRHLASLTWDWILDAVPEAERDEETSVAALMGLLKGLAPDVVGHSERVGEWAGTLMQELTGRDDGDAVEAARLRDVGLLAVELAALSDRERDALARTARESLEAGRLHDLGKLGVPRSILSKPGPLNAVERRVVELHPLVGERMLAHLPGLARFREAVRWHHEKWDGAGYPDGLKGDRTPLVARVLCVADCYDAMTEERPYRNPLGPAQALQEILRCSGSHFDPQVASVFARLLLPELG